MFHKLFNHLVYTLNRFSMLKNLTTVLRKGRDVVTVGDRLGSVTFNLQLGGVPDLGRRITRHTREVPRMPRIKARNAQEARIGVKGRHVHPQLGRQRLPVLEPRDDQGLVALAHPADCAGSHALRQPVLKGKGLNTRRN